jgi:hypothetical protein
MCNILGSLAAPQVIQAALRFLAPPEGIGLASFFAFSLAQTPASP